MFFYVSNAFVILVFAFIGGFVDSAGYIQLYGLFTSSITGNLVVASTSIFKSNGGVFSRLFVTLFFATGAFVSSFSALHMRDIFKLDKWHIGITLVASEIVSLVVTVIVAEIIQSTPRNFPSIDSWQSILVGSLMASSMGIQSVAVIEMIKNSHSTTVMTANIVKTSMAAANALHLHFLAKGKAMGDNGALTESQVHSKVIEAKFKFLEIITVIIVFMLGAAAGAVITMSINLISLIVPIVLLVLLIFSMSAGKRQHRLNDSDLSSTSSPIAGGSRHNNNVELSSPQTAV